MTIQKQFFTFTLGILAFNASLLNCMEADISFNHKQEGLFLQKLKALFHRGTYKPLFEHKLRLWSTPSNESVLGSGSASNEKSEKHFLQKLKAWFRNSSNTALFERGPGFWNTPDDESKTGFFSKLTDIQSQRENWYKYSPYIAEFWCTLSNAGFIYTGIQQNCPELVFAGLASAISHAIPKQWLNVVDKIGIAFVVLKCIREYNVVVEHPWLLSLAVAAAVINAADAYCARNKGQTLPHVIWHLSAAFLAHIFLSYANNK